MRSSARPPPVSNSPRSASTRAVRRPCSWAPRTRAKAMRRRSSRFCTKARHRARRCAVHRRRHRPRRLRHGLDRLALDGDRRHRADASPPTRSSPRARRSPPICWRWPRPTSSLSTAGSPSPGTDRAVALKEVARAAFQPGRLPAGLEAGLYETGTFAAESRHLPQRLPYLRGRDRSARRARVAMVDYTVVDDVGTVINPTDSQGPDPWRRRAGSWPGADGAGRL